jgi:Cu2+-containing amine oxidase
MNSSFAEQESPMISKRTTHYLIVASLVITFSTLVVGQQVPDLSDLLKVSRLTEPLTNNDRTLAIRIAQKELEARRLLAQRTALTEIHVTRNIEAEKKGIFQRRALLIYYDYAQDVGIQMEINLARQSVETIERVPHSQPAIAKEELNRARELVFQDPQLRKALEPYQTKLTIEALLTSNQTGVAGLSGHRLIYLLFRVGSHYLIGQGEVLVDLSSEKIIIQRPDRSQSEPKH